MPVYAEQGLLLYLRHRGVRLRAAVGPVQHRLVAHAAEAQPGRHGAGARQGGAADRRAGGRSWRCSRGCPAATTRTCRTTSPRSSPPSTRWATSFPPSRARCGRWRSTPPAAPARSIRPCWRRTWPTSWLALSRRRRQHGGGGKLGAAALAASLARLAAARSAPAAPGFGPGEDLEFVQRPGSGTSSGALLCQAGAAAGGTSPASVQAQIAELTAPLLHRSAIRGRWHGLRIALIWRRGADVQGLPETRVSRQPLSFLV